jgi:hypothetical protein
MTARGARVARPRAAQFIARAFFLGEHFDAAARFLALRRNQHGTRVFEPPRFARGRAARTRPKKIFLPRRMRAASRRADSGR